MVNPESKDLSVNSTDYRNQNEVEKKINNLDTNDVDAMNEMAKNVVNIAKVVSGTAFKSLMDKFLKKGDSDTMTEVAKNIGNKEVSDKLGDQTDELVKSATEKGSFKTMFELARNMSNIVNNISDQTFNSFVEKVSENGEPNTMTKVVESFGDKEVNKRIENEKFNNFVKKAIERGGYNAMYVLATHSKKDFFADKFRLETIKQFINSAIDNSYDDCIEEFAKNEKLVNNLDDFTKTKINNILDKKNIMNNPAWD